MLERLHPDDPDIYAPNLLDKYIHRPDDLEDMCYADFAANYVSDNSVDVDPEDIRNYTNADSILLDEESDLRKSVIKLTLVAPGFFGSLSSGGGRPSRPAPT